MIERHEQRDGAEGTRSQAGRQEGGEYVIGVDVGTGSARAGLFDLGGRLMASAVQPIQIFRPQPDHVEHSSRDIWQSVCHVVRACVAQAGIDPHRVTGIGFDATCSLVALDEADRPVTVSSSGDDDRNVIVWMDHRATAEAETINATKHRVLEYVGGRISPEMEPPKLRWIKTHLPESWARTRRFFDLADYLVYQACGADVRSLCTMVCKWTYLGHEGEHGSWDRSFFEALDLADLFTPNRVGDRVQALGTRAGGVTARAARELGLVEGTDVAVGVIDAHAGALGSMAMSAGDASFDPAQIPHTLVLIAGTSSCHLAVSSEPRFVDGVWGPYFGALIPGWWLAEGGQSATGALLEHTIDQHACGAALRRDAEARGTTVYELLNQRVAALSDAAGQAPLTKGLHVLPDFHGNRSPRADPHARGAISGLSLDTSVDSLARLYLATLQAIGYGTRHIIDAMSASGFQIERIHASGGGARNPLWLQEHADILGCAILSAPDHEPVLLGAAALAAVASGRHGTLVDAMAAMSPRAAVTTPRPAYATFHARKYETFLRMYDDQRAYGRLMQG